MDQTTIILIINSVHFVVSVLHSVIYVILKRLKKSTCCGGNIELEPEGNKDNPAINIQPIEDMLVNAIKRLSNNNVPPVDDNKNGSSPPEGVT